MNTNGGLGDGSVAIKQDSKKPKYTRFTQQELPACKPLLTPAWVIGTFFVVGVIFLPLGGVSLAASNGVVELVRRYEDKCIGYAGNKIGDAQIREGNFRDCSVSILVTKKMKPPIYVYYELTNFYQNHRRYVKSRSDSQLRGDGNETDLSSCKPQDYLNSSKSAPINPCGLIAWSLFNDTYTISTETGTIPVDQSGISWKSDRSKKFGSSKPKNFNTEAALRGGGTLDPNTPLNEDEHLIVWMRTAALPTFRKLWGKIHTTLEKGSTVNVTIQNNYNTYSFDGKKKIVLSTASWLGGKNSFLGVAYLTVGSLSMVLALLFLGLHLKNPRPLGDTSYLSWNRKGAAVGGSTATSGAQ